MALLTGPARPGAIYSSQQGDLLEHPPTVPKGEQRGTGKQKEEKESKKRKDKFIVNSFHKYGLCKTPPNFIALYKAEDNSIEAIKHNRLPILGIMWHPERFKIFRMKDIKIIKSIT